MQKIENENDETKRNSVSLKLFQQLEYDCKKIQNELTAKNNELIKNRTIFENIQNELLQYKNLYSAIYNQYSKEMADNSKYFEESQETMIKFQQLLTKAYAEKEIYSKAYAEKEIYTKECHDTILSLNQKLNESQLENQKLLDLIKGLNENKLEDKPSEHNQDKISDLIIEKSEISLEGEELEDQ